MISIVWVFILSTDSIAQKSFKLTTADDQNHGRAKSMNAVLIECFNRMQMELEILPMPSKRSLINADNGIEDGNFLRTEGITKTYPNLVKVPERISVNRIVAFSKNLDISIDGWESLLNYHVVYVNGWRNCEDELANAKAVTIVKNEKLLFTLLEKNRAELGVFGQSTGMRVLKKLGYTGIKPLTPPIVISDLFLYVHHKHKHLIPEIVKTLKLMKKDGTYQYLIHQYFRTENFIHN